MLHAFDIFQISRDAISRAIDMIYVCFIVPVRRQNGCTAEKGADVMRLAVLGTASVAQRRMLPAFAACPGVEIAVIASRDHAKAKNLADKFGGEAVEGYAAALERPDIHAVYLPLPNSLHYKWVTAALDAGKHVMSEKPLTTNSSETAEIFDVAESRGLVLQENFAFMHNPVHTAVHALLKKGRIGRPRHFTGSYCFPPLPNGNIRYDPILGGGALLDTGVYPIAAAQFLLGADIRLGGAALKMDGRFGVDIAGGATLFTSDGVIVTSNFGFEHSYGSYYEIWGSAGKITVENAFTPPPDRQSVVVIDSRDGGDELIFPAFDQFAGAATAFSKAVEAGTGSAELRRISERTAELVDDINSTAKKFEDGGAKRWN
jgi:NDP-hexose-3-ketoreductase